MLLTIVLTALLSSLFTIGAFYWLFSRHLRPRLEAEFKSLLDEKHELIKRSIEQSVKQGVIDGVSSIPSMEVLQGTTRTIARTGAGLVEESLNTLLGKRKGYRGESSQKEENTRPRKPS